MKRFSNPFFAYTSFPKGNALEDYNGKTWGVDVVSQEEEGVPVSRHANRRKQRVGFFFIGLSLVTIGFLVRLFLLQLMHGAFYRERADLNRIRFLPTVAPRGILYDRSKQPLVRNVANQILVASPADLQNDDVVSSVATSLAGLLQEDAQTLRQEILDVRTSTYSTVIFREQLPQEQALLVRLHEKELQGFSLEERPRREYLGGPAFAHLLGYVGKLSQEEFAEKRKDAYSKNSEIGKTGIEESFETTLRGKDGGREVEVDASGRTQRILATSDPKPGTNLLLSVDRTLQERTSDSLERMVKKFGGTGAAAVVVNVHNGDILAFVSAPSFDNNAFVLRERKDEINALLNDERKPLFSRPLSGQYPPGSTIKPLLAATALSENIVTPSTVIQSTGGIQIQSWFFPDWKAGGHGATTVTRAIAESINTFFYSIGGGTDTFRGLGITKMNKLLRRFGLGTETGIALRNEASGLLPTPSWKEETKKEMWYIGDTYHAAIGQGDILVTPLQMALATAAIANNGTLFTPRLVTGTVSADGVITPSKPLVNEKHIFPERDLRVVREGMRRAVTDGSSRALAGTRIAAAGKTGTAQFGNENKTHAWFTAFAPYENPEIALAVVVEAGGEGHAAALPVAKDILNTYFDTMP